MLNNLNVDGIDLASECGSYPCPSLFAAMDGGMVCVLGQDDFGVLYIDTCPGGSAICLEPS